VREREKCRDKRFHALKNKNFSFFSLKIKKKSKLLFIEIDFTLKYNQFSNVAKLYFIRVERKEYRIILISYQMSEAVANDLESATSADSSFRP